MYFFFLIALLHSTDDKNWAGMEDSKSKLLLLLCLCVEGQMKCYAVNVAVLPAGGKASDCSWLICHVRLCVHYPSLPLN